MLNFILLGFLEVVDLWSETTTRQKTKKIFHEINGFLSLQLGLSFELGLRLRLTNKQNCRWKQNGNKTGKTQKNVYG